MKKEIKDFNKKTPPKIIGGKMAGYKFVFILYLVFKSKIYQVS